MLPRVLHLAGNKTYPFSRFLNAFIVSLIALARQRSLNRVMSVGDPGMVQAGSRLVRANWGTWSIAGHNGIHFCKFSGVHHISEHVGCHFRQYVSVICNLFYEMTVLLVRQRPLTKAKQLKHARCWIGPTVMILISISVYLEVLHSTGSGRLPLTRSN